MYSAQGQTRHIARGQRCMGFWLFGQDRARRRNMNQRLNRIAMQRTGHAFEMMPAVVQECVLALPVDCKEDEMKREEIEKMIDEKIAAALRPQAVPLSGGGGPTNPTQPGKPTP